MLKIAKHIQTIQPFYAMEILAQAKKLEALGQNIIHMELGEPDFITPQPILEAAKKAIDDGFVHYTPALGLPSLREKIVGFYQSRYQQELVLDQLAITAGASAGLMLSLSALLEPGDQVIMTDPGYPCNRHFVTVLSGEVVSVPVDHHSDYQLTLDMLQSQWTDRSKVVMLASPSNPTGSIVDHDALLAIANWVQTQGAYLLVDEIYHGLSYGQDLPTVAGINSHTIVINSFSKYFGMTGWRLGWLVCDPELLPTIDALAQNLYLAPTTVSQHAALEAFSDQTHEILEQRREIFCERRDYLYSALKRLGFTLHQKPPGAFYLYAGCERFTNNSKQFCQGLLQEAGVATTPGLDFGQYGAKTHLRLAYTTSLEVLQEGVERIEKYLKK